MLVGLSCAVLFLGAIAGNANPVIFASSGPDVCPNGYSQPATSDWTTCYKVFPDYKSRRDAAITCRNENGTLATVSNAFANSYLNYLGTQIDAGSFWLGIECFNGDVNNCMNDDGSPFIYNNFRTGEPRPDGECIYTSASGRDSQLWLSFDCKQKFQFACEVQARSTNGPTTSKATVQPTVIPTTMRTTTRRTTTTAVPTITYTSAEMSSCYTWPYPVDLVIAFDSSTGIDQSTYKSILYAFQQLGYWADFGYNGTRIMVGTYDSRQNFDGTDLNKIRDINSYYNRIDQLTNYGYTREYGNNIDDVLVYSYLTINQKTPFREYARKVLVFISSTGWDKGNIQNGTARGFSNPIPDANILSTCLLGTNNYEDMYSFVDYIANKLCDFRTNVLNDYLSLNIAKVVAPPSRFIPWSLSCCSRNVCTGCISI